MDNGNKYAPKGVKSNTKRRFHKPKWPQLILLVAILVAAVVALVVARSCARGADKPAAQAFCHTKSGGDTIDVAIEISPLTYSLATDTNSGLDYEMLKDMSRSLRRPVRFHPFAPLDYAVRGLRQGVFDMVVSSLHATTPLKEHLRLTDPVYRERNVLVQRKNDPGFVNEAYKLGGDTVWLATASPLRTRIYNLGQEIGDTIYIRENTAKTPQELVSQVADGRVRRAVVNEGLARAMAARYPSLDVSVPVSMTGLQTWAVADSDSTLQRSINTWLRDYKTTPRYRELTSKYLQ